MKGVRLVACSPTEASQNNAGVACRHWQRLHTATDGLLITSLERRGEATPTLPKPHIEHIIEMHNFALSMAATFGETPVCLLPDEDEHQQLYVAHLASVLD